MHKSETRWCWKLVACSLALASLTTSTGCQILVGGQLLPSPWYQTDDVQYFAPGPEFKLSREAAAQKAFSAERELETGP